MKKPGYFVSEEKLLQKVGKLTGTGSCRHPITFLVEAADDIVYSVVDLEDAVKKGLLRSEGHKRRTQQAVWPFLGVEGCNRAYK